MHTTKSSTSTLLFRPSCIPYKEATKNWNNLFWCCPFNPILGLNCSSSEMWQKFLVNPTFYRIFLWQASSPTILRRSLKMIWMFFRGRVMVGGGPEQPLQCFTLATFVMPLFCSSIALELDAIWKLASKTKAEFLKVLSSCFDEKISSWKPTELLAS